jgi:hypothetical protein
MALVIPARPSDSAAAWASALAARLRLIHAGFVDEPPEQRQAFLADELERAVAGVAPSQKRDHLDALAAHFPNWQSATPAAPAATAPLTVAEMVSEVLARLGELSAEDRSRLAAALQPEVAAAATGTHHQELWKKLGLSPDLTPSGERTWRLLAVLLEFFSSLDQLAWALWRNLGARSAFAREAEPARLVGPYLAGDHEVSSEQIRQCVERTRRLVAAILGAPGRAASDVANRHAGRLSPESIEVTARNAKRALESLDVASWREYKQRFAGEATAPHLEAAIMAAVAQAAEDLIGGRTR